MEGGRLFGRGAYDMKSALASMMLAVADLSGDIDEAEVESSSCRTRNAPTRGELYETLVRDGLRADFVVCGEPTDMHVGVQAKGVPMVRVDVGGTAAHGATPWLGDNAVLRAVDLFRRIETLPFAAESASVRAPLDQPGPDPGRRCGEQGAGPLPDGRRRALPRPSRLRASSPRSGRSTRASASRS